MISPRVDDRRPFYIVFGSLVLLAWVALLAWDLSPYQRFLNHRLLGNHNVGLNLDYAEYAGLFVAGWTLMTVAMMLPTVLPLLALFHQFTASRPQSRALLMLVVAGYLAVWVLFGAFAHASDLGIHAAVNNIRWLRVHSWILGAGALVLAGVYQFLPLKYFCLDKCRSPYGFILEHWRGNRPALDALRLGVHHGLFCVGCCWSLMLLMFALAGAGNLAWMLALGAVMAAEKNLPWGRKLSTPVGVVLLTAGVTILVLLSSAGVACAHDGFGC
jgi:predicted metal-binding membrane protein